ncbi:hypothetical protein [Hahella sp. HN01]|uniref:hypothetical protein n=1 Tax=Hahella sp. HN01 TaxID=2847262 RepID=UPI001C1EDC69|nr:hypothetical protein [Hahella sp. HN01]MBU6954543.1 hypothetical protein [Hahella sp. HN01]
MILKALVGVILAMALAIAYFFYANRALKAENETLTVAVDQYESQHVADVARINELAQEMKRRDDVISRRNLAQQSIAKQLRADSDALQVTLANEINREWARARLPDDIANRLRADTADHSDADN